MTKPIYVLNGPNLNLLGTREPEIYGRDTLEDVQKACETRAAALGFDIVFRQSNHEGIIIDWIQEARTLGAGVIINAAEKRNMAGSGQGDWGHGAGCAAIRQGWVVPTCAQGLSCHDGNR